MRIEDLDQERVITGCADRMLRTLESFGLTWDGAVEYQRPQPRTTSRHLSRSRAGRTFECSCSRAERQGGRATRAPAARPDPPRHHRYAAARAGAGTVCFEDRVQGSCAFELAERGDVIVRRRDGAVAYQLAVVVDDARQGVTDVVRGGDLLDSTPWQITLQYALDLPRLRYAHLPLVTEPSGAKLAKSRRSVPLDPSPGGSQLHQALGLLGQVQRLSLRLRRSQLLAWAEPTGTSARMRGVRAVCAAV